MVIGPAIFLIKVLYMAENRQPKFFYGYVIVALAFLIMVVTGGALYTFGVFFKPLSSEFGWSRAMTSGAFSLVAFLTGLLSMVAGRLNDRFGPRIVLSGSGLLLGLGYLLMSQISTTWHLYLFYGVVIGIGMSSWFVPLMSTVTRWFVERRGVMTGIAVAGISAGTMIIPPAASWLISNYGWRTSYAVIGFMVLAVIISAAQFLRRNPGQTQHLLHGQNKVQEESLNLEVGGFSLQEAMRTRQFWQFCVAYFGFGLFLLAIMVHIVPHITELGISATSAANIFIAIGGLSIIGRIVIGGISDRMGNRSALIICFTLTTAALAWLLVAEEMWMFYLFAAVFGFAYGGLVAVQSPLVAELFGLSSHGVILGAIVFSNTIGGTVGPVLVGYIFDITGSYQSGFLICAVLGVIGLILVLLLKPTGREGGDK